MRQSVVQKTLYWSAVVVLIALGVMFALREPPNPDLQKAEELQRKLASLGEGASQTRRDMVMWELNRALEPLDSDARRQILTAVFQDMEVRDARRLAQYPSLSGAGREFRMEARQHWPRKGRRSRGRPRPPGRTSAWMESSQPSVEQSHATSALPEQRVTNRSTALHDRYLTMQ